jgi:hypothetical protein
MNAILRRTEDARSHAGEPPARSDALRKTGFDHYQLHPADLGDDSGRFLEQIGEEFDRLPCDPYGGGTDNRFRSYARGVVLPWERKITWLPTATDMYGRPTTEYYQGKYNPEFADRKRALRALSDDIKRSPVLHRLIWMDFDLTFWPAPYRAVPLLLGVSFIKMGVDAEHRRAFSTPDSFHQDGEVFTFAHLIKREHVTGGLNAVAKPACAGRRLTDIGDDELLATFELHQPLETYAIFDPLVSHYVSPIELAPGERCGERSIMLIDFTPYIPAHYVD